MNLEFSRVAVFVLPCLLLGCAAPIKIVPSREKKELSSDQKIDAAKPSTLAKQYTEKIRKHAVERGFKPVPGCDFLMYRPVYIFEKEKGTMQSYVLVQNTAPESIWAALRCSRKPFPSPLPYSLMRPGGPDYTEVMPKMAETFVIIPDGNSVADYDPNMVPYIQCIHHLP